MRHRWIAIAIIVAFSGGLWYLMETTPTGFVPTEDTGRLFIDISLPPATAMERTKDVIGIVEGIVKQIPEIDSRTAISGNSLISGRGSSYGMLICSLIPFDKRKGPGQDINSVIGKLYMLTSKVKDAKIIIFTPPMVPGFSYSGG